MEWIKLWGLGMFFMMGGLLLTIINYVIFGISNVFLIIPGFLLAFLSPIFGGEE